MADSVNKFILLGNLGKNPEIRNLSKTGEERKVASFSVATSERWKNRETGEYQEKTEWHDVVIYNPRLAELAERRLQKGSKVYIEGQIEKRKWTTPEGQERTVTEVVLRPYRGELNIISNGKGSEAHTDEGVDEPVAPKAEAVAAAPRKAAGERRKAAAAPDLDDEIPF